ncbi:hypothetical protein NBRC110019_08780 [Neptunitalea chrysea]|uniref:2'-5' RNA ligase n=1 Tax=Neptunitalea chrysea TaxID=1647581 RepID=A0A9W6B5U6_9FLAO|nr:2'-5' RNA ligase family protein [Neptunitalea chrysea]GLB51839.1 hypothetical protein NBRC110019_08780 [Neptunitalea chrysea]
MNIHKYSIAIIPDDSTVKHVRALKLRLSDCIGWYHSKNSMAHFTIGEFEGNSNSLQHIHEQIISVCNVLKSFQIHLAEIKSFDKTGTLYIAPNSTSKDHIINVMRLFHQKLSLQGDVVNPHLTIGRRLHPEHIEKGKKVLKFHPTSFDCNAIYLRKYNPLIKQYDVVHTYYLK